MAVGTEIATFFEGRWHRGNVPIINAADHGAWLGSQVFDGARRFEGVLPDLDLHSARIIRSAEARGRLQAFPCRGGALPAPDDVGARFDTGDH